MAHYRKNPKHLRKRTNLSLDPVVWEQAQEVCYNEGISVSELVTRLLKAKVEEEQKAKFAARKSAKTKG